jgi:hypothetical protein
MGGRRGGGGSPADDILPVVGLSVLSGISGVPDDIETRQDLLKNDIPVGGTKVKKTIPKVTFSVQTAVTPQLAHCHTHCRPHYMKSPRV